MQDTEQIDEGTDLTSRLKILVERERILRSRPIDLKAIGLGNLTPEQVAELDKATGEKRGLNIDAENIPFYGLKAKHEREIGVIKADASRQIGESTPEQQMTSAMAQVESQQGQGFWTGVGEMAADSATMMGEMIVGAGVGGRAVRGAASAGSKVAQGVARNAILRGAVEVGATGVGRQLIPKLFGDTPGAWDMASIRRVVDKGLTDEQAEALAESANSALPELLKNDAPWWKGMLEDTLGLAVERGGGNLLTKVPGIAPIFAVQGRIIQKLSAKAGRFEDLLTAAAKGAAYNGPLQEVGEEVMQGMLTEGIFSEEHDPFAGLPKSLRELAQLFIVSSAPTGMGILMNRAFVAKETERAAMSEKVGGDTDGPLADGESPAEMIPDNEELRDGEYVAEMLPDGTDVESSDGGEPVSPDAPTDVNQGVADGTTPEGGNVFSEPAQEGAPRVGDTVRGIPPTAERVAPAAPSGSPDVSLSPAVDLIPDSQPFNGPEDGVTQHPIGNRLFGELEPAKDHSPRDSVSAPDVMASIGHILTSIGKEPVYREGVAANVPKGARGAYWIREQVIDLRQANDPATMAHEVAHQVERIVFGQLDPWVEGGAAKLPAKARAELDTIGRELYGDTVPSGGYLREGWAEFMAYHITQGGSAKAPALTEWFDETFLAGNPKIAKAIARAQNTAGVWRSQGSLQRVTQSIVSAGANPMKVINDLRSSTKRQRALEIMADSAAQKGNAFVSDMIEELDPLRRMSKKVEEITGEKLSPGENPYELGSYLRNSAPARLDYMLKYGMVDLAGNKTGGKALHEIQALTKGSSKDFSIYLYLKRAKALWEQPLVALAKDGQTAAEVLTEYRSKLRSPDGRMPSEEAALEHMGARNPGISYADTLQGVNEYQDPKLARASELLYQWYDGVMDYAAGASPTLARAIAQIRKADPGSYIPLQRVFASIEGGRGGKGMGARFGSVSKRLKGSGRQIIDPFPVIIGKAQRMIEVAHERAVLESVIALGKANDGLGGLIREVPIESVPGATATVEEMLSQAASAAGKTDKATAEEIRDLRDSLGDAADEVVTLFVQARQPLKGDGDAPILPVVEDGEMKWYQVDKDIYGTLAGLGLPEIGMLADLTMGVPKRMMVAGTTGLNPAFTLVANPLRDITAYIMNSEMSNPIQLGWAYMSGTAEAFIGAVSGGRLGSNPYDLYRRLGIPMAGRHAEDSVRTRALAKRLATAGTGIARVAEFAGDTFEYLSRAMNFPEDAPRLAEMKNKAKMLGLDMSRPISLDDAVALANAGSRVTVDFAAGGKLARWWNRFVPFFNVSIQGPRSFGRAAITRKKRVAIVATGMLAASIAYWRENKDEEWYKELSDHERYTYFYFRDGDTLYKIPRSHEIHYLTSTIPEVILNAINRINPESAASSADRATEATMGVLREGLRVFAPPVMPVALSWYMEQKANRVDFFNTPIVPRGLEDADPEDQWNEYTTKAAYAIGQATGISPMRLEHTIRSMTGTVGMELMRMSGRDINVVSPDNGAEDWPIISRIYKRGGPDSVRGRSIESVYDLRKEENAARKKRQKHGEKESYEQRQKRLYLNDVIRGIGAMSRIAQVLDDRDGRNALYTDRRKFARDAVADYYSGDWSRGRIKGKVKGLEAKEKRAEQKFRASIKAANED